MALVTWRDTAIRYINTQFLDGAVSAPPLALQFPTAGANQRRPLDLLPHWCCAAFFRGHFVTRKDKTLGGFLLYVTSFDGRRNYAVTASQSAEPYSRATSHEAQSVRRIAVMPHDNILAEHGEMTAAWKAKRNRETSVGASPIDFASTAPRSLLQTMKVRLRSIRACDL